MTQWLFFSPESKLYHILSRVSDALVQSVLVLLCSLPCITAGSALFGLYHANLQQIRGQSTGTRDFFRIYKENLVFGIVMELAVLVILFVCGLWLRMIRQMELPGAVAVVIYVIMSVVLSVASFVFPCRISLEGSNAQILKVALYLTIKAPYYGIVNLVLLALPVALFFLLPISIKFWVLPLCLLGGVSWLNWVSCKLFSYIFNRQAFVKRQMEEQAGN